MKVLLLLAVCFVKLISFRYRSPRLFVRKASSPRFRNFDGVIEESKQLLNTRHTSEDVVKVALALQKKEKEKEKEIAVKQKEMESALHVQELQLNMSMQASFYKHQISSIISKRNALEQFFKLIIVQATNTASPVHKIIDAKNATIAVKEFKKQLAGRSFGPSMTSVNNLLLDQDIQKSVWSALQLDPSCRFPVLSRSQLLYGILSEPVHNSQGSTIFVADDDPPDIQQFFKELAKLLSREVDIYDHILAQAVQWSK